jgi:hypothetical protein
MVGAYVEAKDQESLAADARRRGMTVADLVRELVRDYIARHGAKQQQVTARGHRKMAT